MRRLKACSEADKHICFKCVHFHISLQVLSPPAANGREQLRDLEQPGPVLLLFLAVSAFNMMLPGSGGWSEYFLFMHAREEPEPRI